MTLKRGIILALGVVILTPLLFVAWLLRTEAGASFTWRQVEAAAGGKLSVDAVTGTLSKGVDLEGLVFRDDALEISVSRIGFAVKPGVVPLSLGIERATARTVRLTVESAAETDGDSVDLAAILEQLALPVAITVDDLVVTDITIAAGADATPRIVERIALSGSLQESLDAVLEVRIPEGGTVVSGTLDLAAPHTLAADIRFDLLAPQPIVGEARIDGNLDSVEVVANGRTTVTEYAPLAVEVRGRADLTEFAVDRLAVVSDDLDLSARGRVGWVDGLITEGSLDVARAEVASLVTAWPEGFPVSGELEFAYSPGTLMIESADLIIEGTATQVSADLDINVDRSSVDGNVEWRSLAWPLDEPESGIRSPAGAFAVAGQLDDWRATGELELEAEGVARDRIRVDASGGRESADIVVHEAGVLDGRLSGNAAVSFTGSRDWSASLDLDDIRTDALLPALPGRLSGLLEASGSASPLAFDARLGDVAGTLAGQALEANGRILFDDGVLNARDLFIRHGLSEVTLNGSPRTRTGVVFSAEIRELGDYLATARGGIRAAGRAGLDGDVPWLKLTAAADRLRFDAVEIEGFRIDDLAPGSSKRTRLNMGAQRISVNELEVEDARAELTVSADSQSMGIDIAYEGLRFAAEVQGALDSWAEPGTWVGELEDLEFAFSGHPPVELANPADIFLSWNRVLIERLCLREPGGASLCAAGGWRAGGLTDVFATMTAMPLQMINALVDTGFNYEQRLDGELEWHQASGAPPSGRASIKASAGRIDSRSLPDVSFRTADSSIGFDIVDGRLLNGSLELPMPGTGEVSGSFEVLDMTEPLDSAIEGAIVASIDDIGLLAALTPVVDYASGELSGRIDIGGSLSAPELSGRATLREGRLHYEPLGMELTDILLTGELQGDRDIDIDGVFTSGAGTGRIASRRREGRGGPIDLTIEGRNLTLINVEDVQAIADLDMGLGYGNGALMIDGSIAVPRALVTPTTLPAGRNVESADVIVVNGELPDTSDAEEQAMLEFLGSLDVELGPDVEVNLGVANATVTGRTLFTWSGPMLPMADGRFDIEGEIQAFGQRLNVTDGRIRFADVSADNPSLRLRAEREIFGNSQVKTAGVLVAGTLNRPTIEAYTVPRTTEERALALLVTGSDFDLEQGVGAVDFGTYIAPRLFVSYGVGIFERDNVISARYDLKRGFGIRATSGQRESGVDLIYRLER